MSPKSNDETMREGMVQQQLIERGITDKRVIAAFRKVARHLFVPEDVRHEAYADRALPLGPEQTISQPYIVALMLQELQVRPTDKVLEIGTGSGYEAALLAELCEKVYSVDIDPHLVRTCEALFKKLGIKNIECKVSDGFKGWPEEAPFPRIVVSASPATVPRELVRQLGVGGRLVLPLGEQGNQELILFEKAKDGLVSKELGRVSFVAMKQEE